MKRRQTDDGDDHPIEKHSRGFNKDDENCSINGIGTAVNDVQVYKNYVALKEQYLKLSNDYADVREKLEDFEQTKYEEEEHTQRAYDERDEARKKAKQFEDERNKAMSQIQKLEGMNDQITKLSSEIEAKTAALCQSNQQRAEIQKLLVAEKRDSEKLMIRTKSQMQKLKEMEAQISDLTKEIEEKKVELQQANRELEDVNKLYQSERSARTTDLSETKLKIYNYEIYISSLKESQAEIEKKMEELEKQFDEDRKKLQDEYKENVSKMEKLVQNFERNVSELEQSQTAKDQKIGELEKQFGDDRQKLQDKIQESSSKMEKLEAQLEEQRKMNEEKNQALQNLQGRLTSQDATAKAAMEISESTRKALDGQLAQAKNELENFRQELNKLQTKYDDVKCQLKNELDSVMQDRQDRIKKYGEMEASIESLIAEHGKTKEEKERIEREFGDYQKSMDAKLVAMEQSVKEEAKKMFYVWKKCEMEQQQKKKESSASDLSPIASDMKKTLKQMNESFVSKEKYDQPQWIVPKKFCRDVYNSNQKIAHFLQNFTSRLFSPVEILLPEEQLDVEKWQEALAVLYYFWKPENSHMKGLLIAALKKMMKDKRYPARTAAYKDCHASRCIAYTSTGKEFWYSWYPSTSSVGLWRPFKDKNFTIGMKFGKEKSPEFGIPSLYASEEYILIIQDSPATGQKIFKMIPSSGFVECIFKKSAR